MVKDFIADHEEAVRKMRETGTLADEKSVLVTTDMLTAFLPRKALWMLRATIAD